MARLFALVVLLIVYGSLYPWRFGSPEGGLGSVVRFLLLGAGRPYWRDVLVNVVFYMPVGACAYLALRRRLSRPAAFALSVIGGAALSIVVEIGQAYEYSRRTSIFDVYANTLGSLAGAIVATVFLSVSGLMQRRAGARQAPDAGALALIVCWLAYLSFPLLPMLASGAYALRVPAEATGSVLRFASAAVAWLTFGNAWMGAGGRYARGVCLISVLLVPALHRGSALPELLGALTGAAFFAIAQEKPWRYRASASALILLLAARGLMPLDIAQHPQAFSWIPFAGMLESDWSRASQTLSAKLFFYGAAVWSLRNAGMRLAASVSWVAALLGLIEGAQVWLARTPEITDPILALMIGVGLSAFQAPLKRTSIPSGTSA